MGTAQNLDRDRRTKDVIRAGFDSIFPENDIGNKRWFDFTKYLLRILLKNEGWQNEKRLHLGRGRRPTTQEQSENRITLSR